LRLTLGGLAALAILVYLGSVYLAYAHSWVKTDNAYLATHIHSVSSRVAGTIQEVLVDENQAVTAGAVLARLDTRDFEVRRRQALGQVGQARAQFQEAEARIAQAHAQVAREQARATKAKNDLARASSLYEGGSGAISKQELELARADCDAANAALQGAQSASESATASAAAAQAQEEVAQASLEDTELQLAYTELVAPAAGRIGKKNLEVGNRIQPGQTVLALVQTDVWVNANFKETQLTHLKPGQPVRVFVDAFPGRTFRGTVESFSPGSGAQFALLPPDNATGNFTKIVQRLTVRILLDKASLGDCAGRLVAGMSALVEVRVRE
jgi:membrane fusion protein (multidrug efflux system)